MNASIEQQLERLAYDIDHAAALDTQPGRKERRRDRLAYAERRVLPVARRIADRLGDARPSVVAAPSGEQQVAVAMELIVERLLLGGIAGRPGRRHGSRVKSKSCGRPAALNR